MTHEDAGHYAKKHQDKKIDETISTALKNKSKNEKITCAAVHAVAEKLGILPREAGVQADLLELRLTKCSLGLFGYEPQWNILQKDLTISEELDNAINNAAAEDKKITCSACWKIAEELKIKKTDVASACEKKGLKIKQCQLGAF